MEKKEVMAIDLNAVVEEIPFALQAPSLSSTLASPGKRCGMNALRNPEVPIKASRRNYTGAYQPRLLPPSRQRTRI